jgi:hypothetical protein
MSMAARPSERAPDLTVDHMVRVPNVERRARAAWDAWGQVRPILLSDQRLAGADAPAAAEVEI